MTLDSSQCAWCQRLAGWEESLAHLIRKEVNSSISTMMIGLEANQKHLSKQLDQVHAVIVRKDKPWTGPSLVSPVQDAVRTESSSQVFFPLFAKSGKVDTVTEVDSSDLDEPNKHEASICEKSCGSASSQTTFRTLEDLNASNTERLLQQQRHTWEKLPAQRKQQHIPVSGHGASMKPQTASFQGDHPMHRHH